MIILKVRKKQGFTLSLENTFWKNHRGIGSNWPAFPSFFRVKLIQFRSSHRRCSLKQGDIKNFARLTGKHLCQSLFLNKVAGLTLQFLLKRRLWHRCFLVNFSKLFRTLIYRTPSGDCFWQLRHTYYVCISNCFLIKIVFIWQCLFDFALLIKNL